MLILISPKTLGKVLFRKSNSSKLAMFDADGVLWDDELRLLTSQQMSVSPEIQVGIKNIRDLGYNIVVVSNQTLFARGEMRFTKFIYRIIRNSRQLMKDLKVDAVFICLHHHESSRFLAKRACRCRKPQPRMIKFALLLFKAVSTESLILGDRITDVEAGNNAQLRHVFLKRGLNALQRNVMHKKYCGSEFIHFQLVDSISDLPRMLVNQEKSSGQALILAAGEGRRLLPLTRKVPKPLLPLGDTTILLRLLQQLDYLRLDIFVNISYLAESFINDRSLSSLRQSRLIFVYEPVAVGTTNTVLRLMNFQARQTLVLHGDLVLSDKAIENLASIYREFHGNMIFYHIRDSKLRNNQMELMGNMVSKFSETGIENSARTARAIVNSGVYIFQPEIRGLFKKDSTNSDLPFSLIPNLVAQQTLSAMSWKGERFSIDSLDTLDKARRSLFSGN